jgi:hypothetical protein
MEQFFGIEPSVDYKVVVGDDGRVPDSQLQKLIRLYFPRTQEDIEQYDFIFMLHLMWHAFTDKQDRMIYDAIRHGVGALNDGSIFSIQAPVADMWAISLSQQAFPNDAPAVIRTKYEYNTMTYRVKINRDFPDPVFTDFLPFGVDMIASAGATRLVIGREGAGTLAWIIGPFPWRKNAEYMVVWDYEDGRTLTCSDYVPSGWLGYPTVPGPGVNEYAPDILMNLILYATKRNLIDDIVVYHRLKSSLAEFRGRMGTIITLIDFIDKFGANTQKIQDEIITLEGKANEMIDFYLDQDFVTSEQILLDALAHFPAIEELARKEKTRALMWVYIIEWLASASTFFISGFVLWTLMVRRRLYREIESTKLKAYVEDR